MGTSRDDYSTYHRPTWWNKGSYLKILGKNIPSRRKSKCKGPGVGINIAFLRDRNIETRPHLQSPVFSIVVWKGSLSSGPVTSEKSEQSKASQLGDTQLRDICLKIYLLCSLSLTLCQFFQNLILYFLKHKIKCYF